MPDYIPRIPSEFVVPLNMNGLRGRMLRMPPPKGKTREILFIYGHHATLERYYGLMQVINDYGAVTMPDLPGFGGMDSFYKINEKPDLDTMADYLAAFVKLRFNHRKRFTVVGASYGFLVVTRMLQRYPDIARRVDLLVSVVGFAHYEDLKFSKSRFRYYKNISTVFSTRPMAALFRNVGLHPSVLRRVYAKTHNAKHKFAGIPPERLEAMTEFEIHLWRVNDARTYMATSKSMLEVDNCRARVDLPVWHVYTKMDNYFNNDIIEQHFRVIFTDYHAAEAKLDRHVPIVLADKSESEALVPYRLRQQLNKKLK